MWQALRKSRQVSVEFDASAQELVQSTLRFLIGAVGALYLGWHFFATATWPGETAESVWLTTILMIAISAVALALVQKRMAAAAVVWQIGLAMVTVMAMLIFQEPLVVLACAALPFTMVVTMGAAWGLAAEAGIILTTWLLLRADALIAFPLPLGVALVALGLFFWLVGWASSRTLYTVTQWSLFAWSEARRNMEDARQHRAQLAKVVKDLDQAYYRLERVNSALVAAWKRAEEAERVKAELVATVSHELRTPLNLVIGFSEMMITSPESYGGVQIPGPYRSDLNAIYNSARHLLQLVDDVLDLSRIEAGKIGLTKRPVDFRFLVTEAVEMVQDYITAKGLQLSIHMPDEMPTLYIDRLRIRQVLLNLLVNAARFTERGGISIEVSLHEGEVQVSVTDTGRGIPEKDLATIFEEYRPKEQVETGWHSGTGLGLPISKKLVELHRGRMGARSSGAGGATFWFTLPSSPDDADKQAGSLVYQGPPAIKRAERTIVLVHDDVTLARLFQRYIEGYHIVLASDSAQARNLAEALHAVAIISAEDCSDAQLPLGTLAVTCPLPSSQHAATELGARELLIKPVAKEELLAAIDRVGRPIERVLIADDDPEMVRLLRRFLAGRILPRNCLEAHTGTEVLRMISEQRPDLVLLDLVMPELGGREVISHLAADPELGAIPVIVISAKADEHIAARLMGAIHLERGGGFDLGELVKMLEANLEVLADNRD